MVQLTYWEPAAPVAPRPAAAPRPDVPDAVAYGYTLADLQQYARIASSAHSWYRGMDTADRQAAAWAAIVDHLLAADEAPSRHELINAGLGGIDRAVYQHERMHGIPQKNPTAGQSMPRFWRYWWLNTAPVPSHENAVIDRLALRQIWPHMSPTHRTVLLTLAAVGDYQEAADRLGKTYDTFASHVHNARKQFLRLWHEHEQPSGVWGADRRAYRRGQGEAKERRLTAHDHLRLRKPKAKAEVPHGVSRYRNHGCRCLDCTEAVRVYNLERARKAGAKPRRVIEPEERDRIRSRRAEGVPVVQVAAEFGVSVPLVYKVLSEARG